MATDRHTERTPTAQGTGIPVAPPLLLPQALNMSTYNCSPHVNYAQVMGPLRIACLNTIMGI